MTGLRLYIFGKNITEVMLDPLQYITSVGSRSLITGDVNCLIKGVSARFLHCIVITFPFVINKYHVANILILITLSSTKLSSYL